jgi:perosamine synthetase
MLAERRRVAARYAEALAALDGLELLCPDSGGAVRGWFVYVVLLPRGVDRDGVVRALRSHGVHSKPYLPAIHLMSYYRETFGHRDGEFPICEDVAGRSLALPFFVGLDDARIERVAAALGAVLAQRSRL